MRTSIAIAVLGSLLLGGCIADGVVYNVELENRSSSAVVVVALQRLGPLDPSWGRAFQIPPDSSGFLPPVVVGPGSPTNNRANIYVLDESCEQLWVGETEPGHYRLFITDGDTTLEAVNRLSAGPDVKVFAPASICGFESDPEFVGGRRIEAATAWDNNIAKPELQWLRRRNE